MTLLTVGHSTLDPATFIEVLQRGRVQVLVDVRSHPGSARYPHFNRKCMERWVPRAGDIQYVWEPRLGGWHDRHALLVPQFLPYGVDVGAYCHAAFPKQRIAQRLPGDNSRSPDCPLHGFNRKLYRGQPDPGPCTCPPNRPTWYICGFYDYSAYQSLPEYLEGTRWLADYQADRVVAIMCAEARWFSCHRGMIADTMWHVYGIDSWHLPRPTQSHSQTLTNRLERYHPDFMQTWDDYKHSLPSATAGEGQATALH